MAIITVQSPSSINGITIERTNDNSLLLVWGPMQAGDEGSPVSVYAYERCAWHFTGSPQGTPPDNANPNIPIMSDRTFTILGTNDGVCWGPIFPTVNVVDPAGMNNRINDPMRTSRRDAAFLKIKPVIGGTPNPAGADCAVLLYCTKFFGPRT